MIFFAAELEIENDETETLCEILPVPKTLPVITMAFPSSVVWLIFVRFTIFWLDLDFWTKSATLAQIGASFSLDAFSRSSAYLL